MPSDRSPLPAVLLWREAGTLRPSSTSEQPHQPNGSVFQRPAGTSLGRPGKAVAPALRPEKPCSGSFQIPRPLFALSEKPYRFLHLVSSRYLLQGSLCVKRALYLWGKTPGRVTETMCNTTLHTPSFDTPAVPW